MIPSSSMLTRLVSFVLERQRIYLRKQRGEPKPWTKDKILQRYKFCNVYREQDTVTRWIDAHIRRPYNDSPHLWFLLCAARQINWPPTLQALLDRAELPTDARDSWSWPAARGVLQNLRQRGEKVYTGAYIISGQGMAQDKITTTCKTVLQPLWRDRLLFIHGLATKGITLATAHAALRQYPGWGDFLAAQVVADLKHTRYLRKATDWYTWAVLGPGSRRGLNRVYPAHAAQQHSKRRAIDTPWPVEEAEIALRAVRVALSRALVGAKLGPPLCAQDTQNCLCEYDKYRRVELGEGRPRALYDGA